MMLTENRVAQMRVTPKHADFQVATQQLVEARRLSNTLNYVARRVTDQRSLNYEHNRTVVDKRRKYRNPYLRLEPLYQDPALIELGVVKWLKQHRDISFKNTHAFAGLAKILVKTLKIVLNAKIVQSVGAKLAEAWRSHAALLDRYWADLKSVSKPNAPGYKRKFGFVEYTKQAIQGGQKQPAHQSAITRVTPTGWDAGVELPEGLTLAAITSARLIPIHDRAYTLEVLYTISVPEGPRVEFDKPGEEPPLAAAMDLGGDVLGAIVFSDARTPILVNGKPVKARNQHANKKNSRLRAIHDLERNNIFEQLKRRAFLEETPTPKRPHPIASNQLDRLWSRRNDQINQYLHTASRRVINMLADAGVTLLAIGWNTGFKSGLNLGGRNNQFFAQTPHARFRDMLIYKGRALGIEVRVVEESYTSKASFLDGDHIPTFGHGDARGWKSSGRRVHRGLFQSAAGIRIHADVNAAYNILAKHVVRVDPTRVVTDTGVVVHPAWLFMPGLSHKPGVIGSCDSGTR